jgi:hypothetical protein
MQAGREITVRLPIKISKRDKYYITSCPAPDVVTQGETEGEQIDIPLHLLAQFSGSRHCHA